MHDPIEQIILTGFDEDIVLSPEQSHMIVMAALEANMTISDFVVYALKNLIERTKQAERLEQWADTVEDPKEREA